MSSLKRRVGRLSFPQPHNAAAVEPGPPVPRGGSAAEGRRRKVRGGPGAFGRIRRSDALAAIRSAASRIASPELRRLAAAVAREIGRERGSGSAAEPGGPLGSLLDGVDACHGADAWLGSEAAVWAVARVTRSGHSKGSAGLLLERLAKRAEASLAAMETGDISSSRFCVLLGRLFGDVESVRRFADAAVAAVEREIAAVVPSPGAVRARGGEAIVRAVAGWAAFREAAGAGGGPSWSAQAEEAFVSALETAVRLLDGSGRPVTASAESAGIETQAILRAARSLGGRPLATTAKRMARGESPADGLSRDVRHDGAGLAILRSGWRRRDVRVLADARGRSMHLEVAVGDRLLFCGPWDCSVTADGVAMEPEGGWEDSCFESDEHATFLEWTLPLSRGLRLERQIVLAPRERVILLGDSIVPGDDATRAASAGHPDVSIAIDYLGSLPVAEGVGLDRADDTREFVGYDTGVRFLAIPLALPEWSAAAAAGRFEASGGRLVLEQRSQAARLHAPIWIDLEPSRAGEPLTWRQLTVADTRQNLPHHRACGYRVQAGGRQWLVYRGLDAVRNRSVLGCNLACEFLLGRVGRSGQVERLIEIQ